MTKVKKMIVGALIAVASFVSIGSYAANNMQQHRAEFIANKLDLNADQKVKFEQLTKVISEQRQIHQADKSHEQIKALLNAPVLDQQQALVLFEQKAAKIKTSAPVVIAAIANFTDSLNFEQKAKAQDMMEMMEKLGRHGGGKFTGFPFR